jgi:hypothetical protein
MRLAALLLLALPALLSLAPWGPASQSPTSENSPPQSAPRVDFKTQIQPLLEARCRPCHFSGGKMYARLPFDNPQTIRTLGTKLFTRIKDEKDQALILSFLDQPPEKTR